MIFELMLWEAWCVIEDSVVLFLAASWLIMVNRRRIWNLVLIESCYWKVWLCLLLFLLSSGVESLCVSSRKKEHHWVYDTRGGFWRFFFQMIGNHYAWTLPWASVWGTTAAQGFFSSLFFLHSRLLMTRLVLMVHPICFSSVVCVLTIIYNKSFSFTRWGACEF